MFIADEYRGSRNEKQWQQQDAFLCAREWPTR
jgi:hypothetical protein